MKKGGALIKKKKGHLSERKTAPIRKEKGYVPK